MPNKKEELIARVNEVFSPSAPIENINLFIGRIDQLEKVKDAIEERGQHIVTYGSRGVGKTSLANIVNDIFQNISVIKVTCNRSDNFTSIWDRAFSKTKFIIPEKGVGYKPSETDQVIRLYLPEKENITAHDIEEVLHDVYNSMLIVFDEFDSISDAETKVKMADTLKSLSDNVYNITVMIVGIASSVDELLGHHSSLERCIKQIHIPLMSEKESYEIIQNNLPFVGLKIEQEVADRIVEYASGFPHYIHLLCKYSSKLAISEGLETINHSHLNWAVEESINSSNQTLRSAYQLAVKSTTRKKNQFEDVIYACSLIDSTKGEFSSAEIIVIFNKITESQAKTESINYNLGMLCREERGEILTKNGKSGETKYSFNNPLMKAFVKLKTHTLQVD